MIKFTTRSARDLPTAYKPDVKKMTVMEFVAPTSLAAASIALTILGGALAAGGSFLGAPLGAAGIASGFLAMNIYSKTDSDGIILNLIPIALISVTAAMCWLLAILMPFALIAAALSIFVSGGLTDMSDSLLPLSLFVIVNGGAALLAMRAT